MENNDFNIILNVYVEDTDYIGIVYYPNYLKYMERARSEWLHSHGLTLRALKNSGYVFAVYKVEIEYLNPAQLNDKLMVTVEITRISKTFLTFEQNIICTSTKKLLAKAKTIMVCLQDKTLKPTRLPDNLINILKAL